MAAIATTQPQAVALRYELEVEDVIAQVTKIQRVMQAVMKKDEHYGTIPGTPKPTLLKAGAEKLCLLFRLDPQYESTELYEGRHLTVKSRCTLYHIATGQRMGSGEGSCSTKESKYAYRVGRRKCPKCGVEAIGKSKFPPRGAPRTDPGGWWCAPKGGGCGAEFPHDDKAVTEQEAGRVPNDDLADQYNTVLKMANKRSLVAGVLNVTAASDIFTQDIEDLVDNGVIEVKAERVERVEPEPRAEAPRAERPNHAAHVWPEPKAGPDGPSYDAFDAITMISKMKGSIDALPDYFGRGRTTKTAIDRFRKEDEAGHKAAFDKLHADYLAWKDQQP